MTARVLYGTVSIALVVLLLQGCAAVLVGTAAVTGAVVASDPRTTGTVIDDKGIKLKAITRLGEDEELWSQSHLNVTSVNGIVLLTGETPTEELRMRAGDIVSRIDKVRQVHNEIAIGVPTTLGVRSNDTWLTSKVKSSLIGTEGVPGVHIKVVTENGTVFLMGLVTREEGDKATDVARRIQGVKRVIKLFEYQS